MEEQLHKYFQGEIEKQGRLELLRAIELDEVLRQKFIEMKNFYSILHLASSKENETEDGRKSYISFTQKRYHKRILRVSLKTAGYAAAIVLLILSTYLITVTQFTSEREKELLSLHVPAGQRLNLTLQDGTTVWLNSRSTLHFPASFDLDERRVSIEGEGYFKVAHDSKRPFFVSSKGYEMKVLGTTFNVNNYSENEIMRMSLLEGSVMVYAENNKSKNIILKPNEQVTIEKGKMQIERIKDSGHFLWTEGIYSFYNEPLDNILRKLELYFDIEIIVKDPTIYTWEYTGKFRQRDGIDEILRIINKIHRFKIEKDEENNRIILSR